jgi:hypothetical protein
MTLSAKIFKDNGTVAVTAAFEVAPVNPTSPASVVSFDSGNFLVVWVDPLSLTSIQGRLYNKEGSALGRPFSIAESPFEALSPCACRLTGATILVTWSTSEGNSSTGHLYGRALTHFATPLSDVNKLTTFNSMMGPSAIAAVANNTAIVVVIMDQVGTSNLYGIAVSFNGSAIGKLFALNSFTLDHSFPSAVGIKNGDAVVTWTGRVGTSTTFAIYAAFVSPAGAIKVAPFVVNNLTDANAIRSSVASVPNGNAFIVWVEENAGSSLVYGRLFSEKGKALGYADFLTGTQTGLQSNPFAVGLVNDQVLVTWSNQRVPATATEEIDVYGAFVVRTSESSFVSHCLYTTTLMFSLCHSLY